MIPCEKLTPNLQIIWENVKHMKMAYTNNFKALAWHSALQHALII